MSARSLRMDQVSREVALELFQEWAAKPGKTSYRSSSGLSLAQIL
ncbi:MAG: hypothetical protein ABJB32_00125 [Verrucomicrobiota bacterium]